MHQDRAAGGAERLLPYVPVLLSRWPRRGSDDRHLRVSGMSDTLSATFAALLTEARDDGADLVEVGSLLRCRA